MMKIAFLINSKILNYKKNISEIEVVFRGEDYTIFSSDYKAHLTELAKNCVEQGYKTLIAVGGDGTLNEVLNGLITAFTKDKIVNWEQVATIKLGVLPLGSGNDFIKNFEEKISLMKIKELINSNKNQLIDIGFADFFDQNGKQKNRYFHNITDLGMGAETMICKERLPIWLGGNFRYFYSILSTFLNYKKQIITVDSADFKWRGEILNLVIANGKFFGNGLGIAPNASVNDGFFDITIIGNVSLLDYAKNLAKVKKALPISHSEISYYKTKEIKFLAENSEKIAIDMDGEVVGFVPIKLTCLHQKINFLA